MSMQVNMLALYASILSGQKNQRLEGALNVVYRELSSGLLRLKLL
jgi:hypothetical protein